MSRSRNCSVQTQRSGADPSVMKPGSRIRNKRKTKTVDSSDVATAAAMPESAQHHSPSDQTSVNDYILPEPYRMKKSVKNFEEADSGSEFERKPSKKVSFNNVVDSRLIKKATCKKSMFLKGAQHDQYLPRSILKKTGCATKKHEKKKGKIKTPKIRETTPACQSGSPKQMKAFLYLDNWKHCKVNWKFEKVIQTWLLKNMFNSSMLPDEKFVLLLEYMAEMRGAAVSLARALTTKIIQYSEQTVESTAENEKQEECRRANLVLQYLPK